MVASHVVLLDPAGSRGYNRGVKDTTWNNTATVENKNTSIDFTYRQGLYTTADVEVRAPENYCSSSVAEME
jgi:hypothetical protein